MSVQFNKLFYGFSREQCDNKTQELTKLFGLNNRMLVTGFECCPDSIDYVSVEQRIDEARKKSLAFLRKSLEELIK